MMLFRPSEAHSLLLTGTYAELTGQGPAQIPISNATGYYNPDDPWTGTSIATPPSLIAQATANRQPPTLFSNGVIYTDGEQDIELKS